MNHYRLCLIVGLVIGTGPTHRRIQAQTPVQAELQLTGLIRGHAVREVSGVAVSHAYPGVLWVHNDSGHEPYIYAMGLDGIVVAVFDVRGARARDWEDIALGGCPESLSFGEDSDCIYIADTGDNNRNRNHVSLYIFPEPDPSLGAPDTIIKTVRSHELEFTYPRGKAYDVEALTVAPDGQVILVSKGRRPGSGIVHFVIEPDDLAEDEARARRVGRLPITPVRHLGRWVTGASISPSGNRLVVRTYTELYFFDRNSEGALSLGSPVCWIGAAEPQGEAVDWLDEEHLVLISESAAGRAGTVYEAVCPEQ